MKIQGTDVQGQSHSTIGVPPGMNEPRRWGTILFQAASWGLCSVLLLWLAVGIFMRNNRFPVMYHPDEWTKAQQILQDERNFNHPQLMLEFAQWLMRQRGLEPRLMYRDEVVFQGRDSSGVLAALAVVLLGWAGFVIAGWKGFALMGLVSALCPQLLAHARYFKEEPSLCLGVAAVILAGAMMCRWRHWAWQGLLSGLMGSAVALAASGKYAGIVMVIPAIVLVVMLNIRRWYLIPIFLILLSGAGWETWKQINWRAVQDWDGFVEGFRRESEHATTQHTSVTLSRPTAYFVDLMWQDTMGHIKVMSVLVPAAWLLTRRRKGVSDPLMTFSFWVVLTGSIYAFAVSLSVIPFYRYILPSTMLLYGVGALGVILWIRMIESRPLRHLVAGTAIAALAVCQTNRVKDFDHQFMNDSRDTLVRWVYDNLPVGTLIVADGYTELNRSNRNWTPARVIRPQFAADAGSIPDLVSRGVQYVAIASSSFDRFLSPHTRPAPGEQADFFRRKAFYESLFAHYPVVWKQQARHPMHTFTNPDIFVFQIRPVSEMSKAR